MKKAFKLLTTALFAICLTFSFFKVNVFAADAFGTATNTTVNNYEYTFYSSVHNDSSSTWGAGSVSSNSGTAPTGFMGVNARLYDGSANLVKSSGWQYNTKATSGVTLSSGKTSEKGIYYAQSQIGLYHGDGYHQFSTKASPRVKRSLVSMIPNEPYKINENGLTYGSDYYAESLENSPDLIRAIGINGVEGYVYSNDINIELQTLEEVLNYINSGQPGYIVPVYTEDGTTVVDSFEIIKED
ncbi:hypothetical protein [Lysinibacillus sp. RC79]|uniref:hypothetical protein n=1 Tax=Lysinibacillus sp. RC79 TaxID=3156296 RepID=UPI003516AD69